MRRLTAWMIMILAILIGKGALIAFMFFAFAGPPGFFDLGLELRGALWFDTGLSMLFFVQHSGMVRHSFRNWTASFVPKEYDRAFYAIASGTVLLAVIVCWQETPRLLQAPDGFFRWSMRAMYWFSLLGAFWSLLSLRFFDPCGIWPIILCLRGKKQRHMPFVVRGAYLRVRHPIYLFMMLAIWSYPVLQMDRLLFNVIWTIWIVIGAFLEERDLTFEFGDVYWKYRREVPMFIPFRLGSKRDAT